METERTMYRLLRDTLADTAVDTDLTGAQKTWAHFASNYSTDAYVDKDANEGKSWRVHKKANAAIVIFDCKNVDADTFTFILYAYRNGGPAEFVCSGNGQSGKNKTDDATARYYADTITSLTQRWYKTVSPVDAGANDGVAKVCFDLCGADRLLCLFTVISSGDDVRARVAYL